MRLALSIDSGGSILMLLEICLQKEPQNVYLIAYLIVSIYVKLVLAMTPLWRLIGSSVFLVSGNSNCMPENRMESEVSAYFKVN